jgi:hypothetical protein
MDDMVLISGSKPQLRAYKDQIEAYLNNNLKLYLNDKTTIRPLTLGIEFCGYKVWASHIKLRKSTAMKMRRRLKGLMRQYVSGDVNLDDVRRSLASYNGMLLHCDSYRLRRKILGVYSEADYQDGWFILQKSKS